MRAIRQLAGLLALFACCADAHAFECAASADAVKQLHPEAWPSWTLRAPGHQGTRCWYASKRNTAHQHPKGIILLDPTVNNAEPLDSEHTDARLNAPSRFVTVPSAASSAADAPRSSRVENAITAEPVRDENASVRETPETTANVQFRVAEREVDEAVTGLRLNDLPLKPPVSSEPTRATDRAFSTPALLAVFGGALVFASMMAGLATRLRRFPS